MPVIACSFNTGWTCRHLLEEGPAVPVTLPHDAALAEPRTETAPGGTNTGWYEGYDYLYEKRFTPDAALQGQTLVLEFEGVYHNAEVWLNGEKLAFNPYGYTDFKADLTGKLDFDAENVLQVIARNADQPNSRWYSGAGIYRPVTLWVGPEAHLLLDGLRVRTVSIDPPEVEVTAAASAPGTVQLQVLDGTTVLASASAEAGKPVRLKLPEAALWSCTPCRQPTAPTRQRPALAFAALPGAGRACCSTAAGSSCRVPASTTTTACWVQCATRMRCAARCGSCTRTATTPSVRPTTPAPRLCWTPATSRGCW